MGAVALGTATAEAEATRERARVKVLKENMAVTGGEVQESVEKRENVRGYKERR